MFIKKKNKLGMKSELFKQKKIISEETECNTRRKGSSPIRNEKEKIQRCL